MDTPEGSGRREHLGPMARSLVQTFAELTLSQQRRVFELLREVLEANEQADAMGQGGAVRETRPTADGQ